MTRIHGFAFLAATTVQFTAAQLALAQTPPDSAPAAPSTGKVLVGTAPVAAPAPAQSAPAAATAPAAPPASPAPPHCDPGNPLALCVPTSYTQAELQELYDPKAPNESGNLGQLTPKGKERLAADCPQLCASHQGSYANDARATASYDTDGTSLVVSIVCLCAIPQVSTAPASAATTATNSGAGPTNAEAGWATGDQPAEAPEPKAFIDSLFAVRLELAGGGALGDITDAEETSEVSASYSNGEVKTVNPSHTAFHFGANLEIAPLRARNVKLAIRGGYLYTHVQQQATVGGGEYETKTWSGGLLRSNAALIGPVLYFGRRWYGSFQLLGGPVSGSLSPVPIGQQLNGFSLPDVDFSGWTLRLGPGFGYGFKTLLLGGDLVYSRSSISLKRAAYPTLGTDTVLHVIGVNFHIGLHF